MKKTLLGVLAFVLLLATVLTATVFAAGGSSNTANVGIVKKVGADQDPIVIDGKMDEAYTQATPLLINTRDSRYTDVFSYGFARFVWSEAENALYCHIIFNDAEVAPTGNLPWESDSVELFVSLTGKNIQEWGIGGLSGDGVMRRGLQYRIDGFDGAPSCFLEEEFMGDPSIAAENHTYYYDADLGRFVNKGNNLLVNETTNIFNWNYSADQTKNGWGWQKLPQGYMVEYRIDGGTIDLSAGQSILFDIQVNDRFAYQTNGQALSEVVYYTSTYRRQSPDIGSNMMNYDSLTLSDETVTNDAAKVVSQNKLSDYGMADPNIPYVEETTTAERKRTSKVTIDRISATRVTGEVTTTKPTGSTTTVPSGNGGSGDNTQQGGGCGSSIAVGTSVAMLALVGATGFLAFRRKDEE